VILQDVACPHFIRKESTSERRPFAGLTLATTGLLCHFATLKSPVSN
jgi:hypothetical protein